MSTVKAKVQNKVVELGQILSPSLAPLIHTIKTFWQDMRPGEK